MIQEKSMKSYESEAGSSQMHDEYIHTQRVKLNCRLPGELILIYSYLLWIGFGMLLSMHLPFTEGRRE